MARGVPLLSLVLVLLGAGLLWNAQAGNSPSDKSAQQQIDQAQQAAAAVTFQQAASALEQFHALNATYAGAPLTGFGVTIVRADANSYCIESRDAHVAGPGGTPAPGHC